MQAILTHENLPQGKWFGICDTQGRTGTTFSTPLLHPAQSHRAFVLQNTAGLELSYCPTGELRTLFLYPGDPVLIYLDFQAQAHSVWPWERKWHCLIPALCLPDAAEHHKVQGRFFPSTAKARTAIW